MKKKILAICTIAILAMAYPVLTMKGPDINAAQDLIIALPSSALVKVDGKSVPFAAYNIAGYNYFKLRDLAASLDGSNKQLDVDWDQATRQIDLQQGKPYDFVGGELSDERISETASALAADAKVNLDGQPLELEGYNIAGNNYYKLRDLGRNLNFGIGWNDITDTITIDTNKTYSDASGTDHFGQYAYSVVETIQENYSNRLAGSQKERDTAAFLKAQLSAAGYAAGDLTLRAFDYKEDGKTVNSQNVIAAKTGTSSKIIVVGAHYDSVKTHGIDDNGGSVAVLLETAVRMKKETSPYTIRFVLFGGEEDGKRGSYYYIKEHMTEEERSRLALMINLDSILAGDKQYLFGGEYLENGSMKGTWAVEQAKAIADKLGLITEMNPDMSPEQSPFDRSDHIRFRDIGVPYIFLWAGNLDIRPYNDLYQTEELGKIMHSANDDLTVLNSTFPGRVETHLHDQSLLLYHLLKDIKI